MNDIVLHLKIIHAVLICAAKALREQSVEMDSDIALAIQRCGSDVIGAQLERLNKLLDPSEGDDESELNEEGAE